MREDRIRSLLLVCWSTLRSAKNPALSERYYRSTIEAASSPQEIGRALTALVAQTILFNPRPPKLQNPGDVVDLLKELTQDAPRIRSIALATADGKDEAAVADNTSSVARQIVTPSRPASRSVGASSKAPPV
jgi:hypothetical protein